jgi:AbrB family looped-hinge helix DNA binding protein
MRTSIDQAGRIVVPKAIREGLGWRAGDPLDISARNGVLEVAAEPVEIGIADTKHGAVAVASDMPPLTDEMVRATLEAIRP